MGGSINVKNHNSLDSMFADIEKKLIPETDKGYLKIGIITDPTNGIDAEKTKTVKVVEDEQEKVIPSPKGINIIQIAAVHEFGSEKRNIPQRSFLRSTFDEQRDEIPGIMIKLFKSQMRNGNIIDEKAAFLKLGAYITGKVREKFRNNDWEPIQDPTRRGRNKEGNATPLIDTGQLRRATGYAWVENES